MTPADQVLDAIANTCGVLLELTKIVRELVARRSPIA
jgi:hypothetical protein